MAQTSGCAKTCKGHRTEDTVRNSFCSAIESSTQPMPYTFRVPAPNSRCIQQTRAPPFYLQLDHTLAVLWCLFRKQANICVGEECELGIGQLQWTLYFLKGIKTPSGGDRAEDVSLAIQTVQDALIDLYADMASVVMQTSPSAVNTTSCSTCESIRRGFTGTGTFPKSFPKSSIPSCDKCHSLTFGDQKEPKENFEKGNKKQKICVSKSKIPVASKPATPEVKISVVHVQKCPKESSIEAEIRELKKLAIEFAKLPSSPTQTSKFIPTEPILTEEHIDPVA